jgi:hypothetical protein
MNAARKSLGDLVDAPPDTAPRPAAAPATAPAQPPAAAPPRRAAALRPAAEPVTLAVPQLPKYLTLQRVEARLTEDQADELSILARRLDRLRQRAKAPERITSNTLLRIAAQWLVVHGSELAGVTEAELAASVGVDMGEDS